MFTACLSIPALRLSPLLLMAGLFTSGRAVAGSCDELLLSDGFETGNLVQFQVAVEVNELGNNQPGRELALQLNDDELLTLTSDGTFCFIELLNNGQSYAVAVESQPTDGNRCVLNNASGMVGGLVTVQVACDGEDSLWDQMLWDQNSWQ